MSGPARKHSKGRTFLIRQRCKVRVDSSAWMLPYELDAPHEAAEICRAENFRFLDSRRGRVVGGKRVLGCLSLPSREL